MQIITYSKQPPEYTLHLGSIFPPGTYSSIEDLQVFRDVTEEYFTH